MNSTAYLRVSSRAQDFATEKAAIERAASARGDSITTWYSEKRSGKLLAGPELDRLRRDARAGAVRRLFDPRKNNPHSREGVRVGSGAPGPGEGLEG
jgi:DNA invertase Pin-like site-specific DNA recombinase